MTRLRKLALERALPLYHKIAKNPVHEHVVQRGLRLLHADDLRAFVDDLDDVDIISAQKISDTYLDQLAEYFPESIDEIQDEGWNPLWYHR